jgi:PBSX family phage terminase large subunit
MVQSYDEDYKRRYLYGVWGSFEGQVYKDFNYEQHVGDFRGKRYKYYLGGFDDGTRNPACFLTSGIDDDNNLYIVDELYQKGLTDTEKLAEIVQRYRQYKHHKVYSDPSATNMKQLLRDEKIRTVDADNDVYSGISKLKSYFKNNLVFIDKSCKNLLKELESYRYDKGIGKGNPTEQPVKKNDHACDALRYLVTDFNPFKKPTFCGVGRW